MNRNTVNGAFGVASGPNGYGRSGTANAGAGVKELITYQQHIPAPKIATTNVRVSTNTLNLFRITGYETGSG